ncbi:type II secretion system protein GspD [Tenacibaculum jejuense]|uniref:Putative bacterial general secretion pathway protein D n=1 Tax=Tenacibaculum jejuense TaxID=584609 RepID=A0A238U8S8_9FLAO|nr:type II secretion system protein GspD [Tenacibaculum jejuense]SNR15455.1 Putative bacterial general secretion pathway protein D [Tenacibaculum jejuense]
MKRSIVFILLTLIHISFFAQVKDDRIKVLERKLDSLTRVIPALAETVDYNINDVDLPTLLNTIAEKKKVNFSISTKLSNYRVSNNFVNVTIKDVLLHLCSEYSLTFDAIGNIISIRKFEKKVVIKKRVIPIEYDLNSNLFSIDLKNDSLSTALRRITEVTGKNMLYGIGSGSKKITAYIKNKPLEGAIDKIAYTNNLTVTKTKDGYYLFESLETAQVNSSTRNGKNQQQIQRPTRYRSSNFYFKVKDSIKQILEVDFDNTDVGSIIKDIGLQLNIDMYTDTALSGLSKVTFKAKEITYDQLLTRILEDNSTLTFKKENNIYYFSGSKKEAIKSYVTIPLMHRSIEIMTTPSTNRNNNNNFNSFSGSGNIGGFGNQGGIINGNNSFNSPNSFNNRNTVSQGFNQNRRQVNQRSQAPFSDYNNKVEALLNIVPKGLLTDLDIKVDTELNSFIVAGDTQKIDKFRKFIKKIDKPIPVILIEVMILEVNKTSTVDTGVEFGLGDAPVNSSGKLFPSSEFTLGANTLNKIIGGFNGFGSLNVGRVVPNFYAKIQAMETNGNIKIRSTPKLATLNGHEAVLSNGARSYYAVVRRDIIGTQNPQTTEIRNYVPIDADLSISIRPMVAGDKQITLSINVLQSSFNESDRIDDEAPPGINSREFTSIVRVKDQDIVILGGLEENLKNDSGSGVPFLARIPVIKWLFSKKTRIDSKKKLSVLIKPTIIK